MSFKDLPEAIEWHEGMLLAPQHFQQQALRQEQLLHLNCSLLNPFHWGVTELELGDLRQGAFVVEKLAALFPDGLGVSATPTDSEMLQADLNEHRGVIEKEGPVTVYLVVSGRRDGAATQGESPRFESVAGPTVIDESAGREGIEIPRLHPKIALWIGSEAPPKFSSIPIAKIAYVNGAFTNTFVPPCLQVRRSDVLGQKCAKIASDLRERATSIAERIRSPTVSQEPALLLNTRFFVHSMVSALPQLESLVASESAHPFQLYLACSSLVGSLAGVGTGSLPPEHLLPPVLEPYDHNDLESTFEQISVFVRDALREGLIESHSSYPFQTVDDHFEILWFPEWQEASIVLAVRSQKFVSDEDSTRWMEAAIIGSKDRIPALQSRRVLGLERKASDAEGDLVATPGLRLFVLQPSAELLEAGKPLMVHNPDSSVDAHRPAHLILYVKKTERDSAP